MGSWGKTDLATNSVAWAAQTIQAGSGHAAQASNNTALYSNTTVNAFKKGMEIGQFAVTKAEIANGGGESTKTHGPGWHLRRAWEGRLVSVSALGGTGFANGETVKVSGGSSNATLSLTTNATGNVVSAAVSVGGLFNNTGVLTYTY